MAGKLTWDDVHDIRKAYENSGSKYVMQELANKYGVSYRTIWGVIRGASWADDNYKPDYIYNYCGESVYASKLTWEKVREIRRIYKPGDLEFGCRALAKRYGVSASTISSIVKGDTWKEN